MKFLMMVLIAGFMVGCSSMPTLKDLNKIDAGMTKKQVMDKLGEPKSKKMLVDGREIYEYDMKDDDGEIKPRVVVFQDKEVVFYGRPSEFQAQQEKRGLANGNGGGASVVVNPNINPVFNPIINVGMPQAAQQASQPSIIYQQAPQQMLMPSHNQNYGNGSYFHSNDR